MKRLFTIVACLTVLLSASPAPACGPCGSGVDCQHIADICDEALFVAEYDCVAAACAMPCASWLSVVAACPMSDQPIPYDQACISCMAAPAPMGCGSELSICGSDTTGGITCAAWLAGGDGADLLPYNSLDAAAAVSDCVCSGACGPASSGPCSTACLNAGYGYYLEPGLASNGCTKCELKRCGPQMNACLAL